MMVIGPAEISVGLDLNGGIRISLGSLHFVLSPQDAFEFAKCIAVHAGAAAEMGPGPARQIHRLGSEPNGSGFEIKVRR